MSELQAALERGWTSPTFEEAYGHALKTQARRDGQGVRKLPKTAYKGGAHNPARNKWYTTDEHITVMRQQRRSVAYIAEKLSVTPEKVDEVLAARAT